MNRRKSLKILGGSVVGIAGLAIVNWKWHITDQLTHQGFFSFNEEKLISSIADTIIPEGLPPIVPNPDAKPIGALSTGTDLYLKKLFEHCYDQEEQVDIKKGLQQLNEQANREFGNDFYKLQKTEREASFMRLASSDDEKLRDFFNLMKSQTITGFTTVKEVMVDYRGYQVAPGFYHGCADVKMKA